MSDSANIDWEEIGKKASRLLSGYVRIRTVNPPGDELQAARYLAGLLKERGFEPHIYESAPNRANLRARLKGKQEGGGIILLHHMDVVPAEGGKWSVDPFSGEIREGFVWGRGTLDMKGAGIMHLLALDLLRCEGIVPERDILFLAVSDEEAGGVAGTRFMLQNHREALKAEYVWDEGGFGLRDMFGERVVFTVAVAEKGPLWLRLVVEGEPGHGSVPHGQNPICILAENLERLRRHRWPIRLLPVTQDFFNAIGDSLPIPKKWLLKNLGFSPIMALAKKSLLVHPALHAMLQNTVSPTMLKAGAKENVIPHIAEATLDVRLLPSENPDAFITRLGSILDPNVRVEVIQLPSKSTMTLYRADPMYVSIAKTCRRLVPESIVAPLLTPGATDSSIFRQYGYKTYGLYPAVITAQELACFHGADERISQDNLSFGTRLVYEVLADMCIKH